ncbi:MAG: AAA family ATPase [Cellulosilyticaceae bacterium]
MKNEKLKIKAEWCFCSWPKRKQSEEAEYKIATFLITEIINGDGKLTVGNKQSVKGFMPPLTTKDEYTIQLDYIGEDPTYGPQYKIAYINAEYDIKTNSDAKVFLERILTEVQFKNVMEVISDPLEVISSGNIDELLKVPGIGEKTARSIIEKYNDAKDYSQIYIQLAKYDFSENMINKLINKYKSPEQIAKVLRDDVYQLTSIPGIGFVKADEIFLDGGGQPKSPKRIYAYIMHYLSEQAQAGNSWVQSNILAHEVYNIFGRDLDKAIFGGVIRELESNDTIRYDRENKRVGLTKYYKLEVAIARELKRIAGGETLPYSETWENTVDDIEQGQGWKYTDEQHDGIKTILDNSLVVVTGLGGTGKTTLINAVTAIYSDMYAIRQCALSGCASQRIAQVSGYESATIHRTLGYSPAEGFAYNESNQLDTDVVILDEASMVGGYLFLSLLKAIRTGTKLIILGDYGQLESIGECNVFFDILASELPIVKLTQVHRQAAASAIISKSKAIREKKQLFDKEYRGRDILGELQDLELNIDDKTKLQGYAVKQYLIHSKKQGIDNVMGVTPMRDRGQLSCYNLNCLIQDKLELKRDRFILKKISQNMSYRFYVGDKVINIKNNYNMKDSFGNKIEVFNGNVGIVQSITGDKMIVRFTGMGDIMYSKSTIDQLELAYFVTIHKSQGSQAHTVITAVDYSAFKMLSNELLYTAISRARKYCILVGENAAIRMAISQSSSTNKNTYLRDLLNLN